MQFVLKRYIILFFACPRMQEWSVLPCQSACMVSLLGHDKLMVWQHVRQGLGVARGPKIVWMFGIQGKDGSNLTPTLYKCVLLQVDCGELRP